MKTLQELINIIPAEHLPQTVIEITRDGFKDFEAFDIRFPSVEGMYLDFKELSENKSDFIIKNTAFTGGYLTGFEHVFTIANDDVIIRIEIRYDFVDTNTLELVRGEVTYSKIIPHRISSGLKVYKIM